MTWKVSKGRKTPTQQQQQQLFLSYRSKIIAVSVLRNVVWTVGKQTLKTSKNWNILKHKNNAPFFEYI